jgi:hypothetical protein
MKSKLRYDVSVRRLIPASVALFGLLALSLLAPKCDAQINGAPASVTSPGFGGQPINGPRASVTSLGPFGYAPGPDPWLFSRFRDDGGRRDGGRRDGGRHREGDRRHHHHFVPYDAPLVYAYPLPYAVDIGAADAENNSESNADDQDANYQGGPTVFDRRGFGRDSYVPPVKNIPTPHSAERTEEATAAPEPLEPTTLVFKDGHKLEVENYAIIGQTLFDMTPGHARKVPLADLDLEATRRVNDERGVTFALPISSTRTN